MPSPSISPLSSKLLRLSLVLSLLTGVFTLARPARAQWSSLTGLLPAHSAIDQVMISSDSKYVIFTASIATPDLVELYSVPITGTTPTRISPPLVDGGDVFDVSITTDSQWVLYSADQEVDQRVELYKVPIAGGQAVKLNSPLVSGGNVISFAYAALSGYVIYQADQEINDAQGLYGVPLSGGVPVTYSQNVGPGSFITSYVIDPVGGRVIFWGSTGSDKRIALFSTPLGGGPMVALNPTELPYLSSYRIAPGLSYLMFTARADNQSQWELYGVNTDGTLLRKRNYPLKDGENVLGFRISPSLEQVVYVVGADNHIDRGNLFRANLFSGLPQLVTELADPGYGVQIADLVFSPDGNRIVYYYKRTELTGTILQSAWIGSGPLARYDLYTPSPYGYYTGPPGISPDNQWVVSEIFAPGMMEAFLYAHPITGGSSIFLGLGHTPRMTPDGQRVIYLSVDSEARKFKDVMSVQIFSGGERNLSQMPDSNNASFPHISPDGRWIVYPVIIDNGAGYELRVSDGEAGQDVTPTPTAGTPVVTQTPTGTLTATPGATPSATPSPGSGTDSLLYLNLLQR